ncbi:DUF2924 domain-containing protein [Phenylobacterium sp.]|jgi:hypothetical protein|uniref:DUF2924 domain-containing protein n=1 Tax=Phenylobacterium sp. TaxID=1871053 RepID=UPI002E370F3B|nr:DUF2924 domain-containing protein [Phenylobacterium sp.]HEX3365791.1 DUF2924 domain-containing protein [Phenylobacterium sp.]
MTEAADLQALGLEDLRTIWRGHYGAPPTLRSPELLALILAWRMQAEVEGGLDGDFRRTLRRPPAPRNALEATPGSRLIREWQGVPHEVVVLADGRFAYRGDCFASLSEVARQITGARWNGPRFFGLRPAKAKP